MARKVFSFFYLIICYYILLYYYLDVGVVGGTCGIFNDHADRCSKPEYPIKAQNNTNQDEKIVGGSEAAPHSLTRQIRNLP